MFALCQLLKAHCYMEHLPSNQVQRAVPRPAASASPSPGTLLDRQILSPFSRCTESETGGRAQPSGCKKPCKGSDGHGSLRSTALLDTRILHQQFFPLPLPWGASIMLGILNYLCTVLGLEI